MVIKKGDTVAVIAGKDRGKTGKVLRIDPEALRVVVEGVNLYRINVRPKREGDRGQIVTLPRPIAGSNVMLYCNSCGRGVRVGMRIDGANKRRQCKRCKADL